MFERISRSSPFRLLTKPGGLKTDSRATVPEVLPAAEAEKLRVQPSELDQLLILINESSRTIEKAYKDSGTAFPSVNDTTCTPPLANAETAQATSLLVAACKQLIATVTPAPKAVINSVMSFHIASNIRVAVEAHVAEALRNAGGKGLHVSTIAGHTNIKPENLARCLRLLATNHVFREVAPETFAHSRLSLALDTGKDIDFLAHNGPETWYEGSDGVAALCACLSDEIMKSSSYLSEHLQDPTAAPGVAPLHQAFPEAPSLWGLLNLPDQAARLSRFNIGMQGTRAWHKPDGILDGIGWETLPADTVCVDVGGGVGWQMLIVNQANPNLNLIVQDQATLQAQATAFLEAKAPQALQSGRIRWDAHDFFQPQPIRGAAIYMFRACLHFLRDEQALAVLHQTKDVFGPNSKLLIVDAVISLACKTPSDDLFEAPTAPDPLLANCAEYIPLALDAVMMTAFEATERTYVQWRDLLGRAGFKIVKVTGDKGGMAFSNILCELAVPL